MTLRLLASIANKAVTANTPIFGAANLLKPIDPPSRLVIYAEFALAGILTALRTPNLVAQQSENLGNNANLTANGLQEFDYVLDSGDTLDFQFSVTTTCIRLSIYEVTGETG